MLKNKKLFFLLFIFNSLFFISTCETEVYDCFCFYNEFDLLKMRLEELWEDVDHFVLVESIETQKGDAKPLYFENNKTLFSPYLDKIIHIKVEEHHPEFTFWERENYQRNCIMRGLTQCKDSDIIIISDVDEIPRPALFSQAYQKLQQNDLSEIKEGYGGIVGVTMKQSLYFFQINRLPNDPVAWGNSIWTGTVFTNYRNLRKANPQYFRDRNYLFPKIHNGGWHFTWMGGRDRIRLKSKSVIEGDEKTSFLSDQEIDAIIQKGAVVPIDNSFPQYVLRNLDYLQNQGYIAF